MRRATEFVRRKNGEIWIHNAVALDDAAMSEIEAWGKPTVLLVPSGYHRIDPARFKERYPQLKIYAPKGSAQRVAEKVAVDGTFDDLPQNDEVAIERIEGIRDAEAAVRVTSDDGVSLLLCDAVFNMKHRPGFSGLVLRMVGSSGGPKVTNIFRLAVLKDKEAFRESLKRLASIPNVKRVLVQHEDPLDAATLRQVAESV
jgi:hypothetical protein